MKYIAYALFLTSLIAISMVVVLEHSDTGDKNLDRPSERFTSSSSQQLGIMTYLE